MRRNISRESKMLPGKVQQPFCSKWSEEFFKPVFGNGIPLTDRYSRQFCLKVLGINHATAVAMLLAMVFDEDRSRARRGLDCLRRRYARTHPQLASLWGRARPGHPSRLSGQECLAIALACHFGIKKATIVQETRRNDEVAGFDTSLDKHQYDWVDRRADKGRKLEPQFSKECCRLEAMTPTTRKNHLLLRLRSIGSLSPSPKPTN